MRYENAIVIAAPASLVWDLTADVSRRPEFTPTTRRVEPLDPLPLQVGGRARVKQPMLPEAVWTVAELEPGRRFVWRTERGGLAMTGAHLVEAIDGTSCRNTLSIDVTGKRASGFAFLFGAAVRRSITRENGGFRREAERRA